MLTLEKYTHYLAITENYSANTVKSYVYDASVLLRAAKERAIDALTSPKVAAFFIRANREEHYRQSTLLRLRASMLIMNKFLRHHRKEPLKVPDVDLVEEGAAPFNFLTAEQIDRVRRVLGDGDNGTRRNRLIFEMLLQTGIKVSQLVEILAAKYHQKIAVVEVAGTVHHLPAELNTDLWHYFNSDRPGLIREANLYLFPSAKGEHLDRRSVWRILRRAGRKAHLPFMLNPDVLRATYAGSLLKAKTPVLKMMELLGYRDSYALVKYLPHFAGGARTLGEYERRPARA